MSDSTPRLALPLLAPGQAQKEAFHNEAIATLDAVVHAVAETIGATAPPADPAVGAAWIVGDAPTGAWTGHGRALASWTTGGWRFVDMPSGALVWVRAEGVHARRTDDGWSVGTLPLRRVMIGDVQVVGAQRPGIAGPIGGTTVDTEARAAVAAVLAALQTHGLIGAP